eukprot:TRINITY_DN12053_c0_g1_i1.p1 TRINITY_DN12053_c0_g1~~TRINITY_DN12053_c0_g1_i1.p1  ORF type:complete len:399 (-),score=101.43 TRINITY_DN12053_c0_g1_i1:23-1219(-)
MLLLKAAVQSSTPCIHPLHVNIVYEVHIKVVKAVRRHQIGKLGGPYDFNLREIEKLIAVLQGIAPTQGHHLALEAALAEDIDQWVAKDRTSAADSRKPVDALDKRGLRNCLNIVYAAPFQDPADQQAVQNIIATELGVELDNSSSTKVTTDLNLHGFTRIGCVYLAKGAVVPSGKGLYHTQQTLEQLENVAAASQSKRVVMLEGETCSRKTSLVVELARLCHRRLRQIAITSETEVSALMGSWTPVHSEIQRSRTTHEGIRLFAELCRTVFVEGLPTLAQSQAQELLHRIADWQVKHTESAADRDVKRRFGALCELAAHLRSKFKTPSVSLEHSIRAVETFEKTTLAVASAASDQTIFVFAEGPLLDAMRNGYWVLLDDLNSAPADLFERFNSLAEAE